MTVQETALRYLYREQRNAKQAHSQAEYRTGVTQDELDNLSVKLEGIDYCITLVLAATHETPLPVEFLKRALVEVRDICKDQFCSKHCPFVVDGACPLSARFCPADWKCANDWKEDGKDAKDAKNEVR